MGHQTHIKECDKCKGITITTKVFNKLVIDTNCFCNKPKPPLPPNDRVLKEGAMPTKPKSI
jgi:hypothetical protein